ncbi:MAG: hypothetical protein H7338_09140 [Candidatus Sericytochromatia bacterium]|nr:hypothetical protein [Candidatus Sericytochromatia bacterium]
MSRRLATGLAVLGAGLSCQVAAAEPKPPAVIHVGLSGGAGPVVWSSTPGTTGFSWSLELDGDAPGIGESGLGFREMRLYRTGATADAAFTALFRQIRLRSSIVTLPAIPMVVSWQGGVILQDFQRGDLSGVKTRLPGVKESMIGGELGARVDWHLVRWFAPYLAVAGIAGGFVDPATATAATTASAGNVFGLDAVFGIASRWPITIPWGEERFTAEVGGKAELYYWNLLNEQLVGLDFRLGTYF